MKHKIELKVPWFIPEPGMMELVKWLVKAGDLVTFDQDLVELLVDGESLLLPAPWDGEILDIRAASGEILEVGQTLAMIEIR